MSRYLKWTFFAVAVLLVPAAAVAQTVIYLEDFNDRTVRTITDPQDTSTPGDPADGIGTTGGVDGVGGDGNPFWSWNGPDSGNVTHTWNFVSDGSGGTQLEVEVDGALAVGTDWWWGLGIGKSGIYPPVGVSDFSQVRFEADIQIVNPNTAYTPPNNKYINVHLEQEDTNTMTLNFAADYLPEFPDANPLHVSFTLDQATHDGGLPDILDPTMQLTLRFDWNNWNNGSDMGLDDDNILRLDNLQITILDLEGSDGDLNDDGFVDDQDIDILWNVIRPELAGDDDPGANDTEDLNGDGFVNEDDVDYMLANLLTAGTNRQYGDADLDGGVGGLDYTAWRQRAGTGWANGDFDGDGGVGGLDYTLWRTRPTAYPTTVGPHPGSGGPQIVPEPASLVLLGLGLPALALLARRRKTL